jgi:hypothetical protein
MRKLQIDSLEELEAIFREKTISMTDTIRESIQEAFTANKKTAVLFEIEIEGTEPSFEISITVKEWIIALENCLKHYVEWEMADEQIDTYLLIKNIKEKYYE